MKLSYDNHWESYRFLAGGKEQRKINSVRINGLVYEVTPKKVYNTYSDHGHEYGVTTTDYEVTTDLFGKPFKVRLTHIMDQGVPVYLDK